MHVFLIVLLFMFALWLFLGTVSGITRIGQPRKPVTPVMAAQSTVFGITVVSVLVWAALVIMNTP